MTYFLAGNQCFDFTLQLNFRHKVSPLNTPDYRSIIRKRGEKVWKDKYTIFYSIHPHNSKHTHTTSTLHPYFLFTFQLNTF